jgi:aldehyde dehydrogenase (NAD+)
MLPEVVLNYIDGKMCLGVVGHFFTKRSPHSGEELCKVIRSNEKDVDAAVDAAVKAQPVWADQTEVSRGDLMRDIALRMRERKQEIAEVVALETGKAVSHALGETDAAIEMGMFIAGEGRRNYGKTTTATMAHRQVFTVRQPLGIAALIIASNTPIANVAWKAFPAMFCGNAAIMKPSEDTPATAWIFADICREVGVPPGVFNVVQGFGAEAGAPLVLSPKVDLVSFTGGSETGSSIQKIAGERLAKVCLELGGKNALVVCDDADLEKAAQWVIDSAFSNAGQRCAAASRIIIFDTIYDEFREILISKTEKLSIGPTDSDFLGPVINESALERMLAAVKKAVENGAEVVVGGERLTDAEHIHGYYMAPTIIENVKATDSISTTELFGPITNLYRVGDFTEAIDMANYSSFGLTASIHTACLHRAMQFARKVRTGVVVVNGGTHGSEPHMGFGGLKQSGTGWREAGTEALDVYSDWKYINLITDPDKV